MRCLPTPQEKCSLCHSPWLNATWPSAFWYHEQEKPSLEGRSAECGPQLPTTPPATLKIFETISAPLLSSQKGGGALLYKP